MAQFVGCGRVVAADLGEAGLGRQHNEIPGGVVGPTALRRRQSVIRSITAVTNVGTTLLEQLLCRFVVGLDLLLALWLSGLQVIAAFDLIGVEKRYVAQHEVLFFMLLAGVLVDFGCVKGR